MKDTSQLSEYIGKKTHVKYEM